MIANVFKPNLLCNKTTFFARAAHHILPGRRCVQYFLIYHEAQWPFIKYSWMVFAKGLWSFGPCRGQSPWHQPKKFLFPYPRFLRSLRLSARHLGIAADRGGQPAASASASNAEAIGFASQSIPGMKAFQFGLEMRFFYLYYKGY